MAPRSTPALAAAIALFALAGAARAQNALGGGRALDGGLANLPGGRVNPSATDYQSILRYNTNAGNALNGPGIDINALNARGSLATSFNRPFLLAPFAGGPAGGRLTGFNNADPLGAT
ncbi:MAG: hypothetical protein K2Q09_08500, partial [Phycisphaerales bacterium]|nr:hypothetical protein [Phycisphaerales bacterium]